MKDQVLQTNVQHRWTLSEARLTFGPNRNEVRVAQVMTAPVVSVGPLSPVAEAEWVTIRRSISHLPVLQNDELVGIVCACDLWEPGVGEQVQSRMTAPVVTISAAASVEEAAERMRENDVGALPVMVSWRVCGIVTLGDLARAGAILPHELGPSCVTCGSRHHVRGGVAEAAFCLTCTDTPPRDVRAHYQDLGGGD